MAKVIPFPSHEKQTSDRVEEIISAQLSHKHPQILKCLKAEMTELVKKYFANQEMALSLELPRDLNDEQFSSIKQSIQKTIGDHSRQMSKRSNQLFLDLCLSRMAICELRHQIQKDP